MGRHNGQERLVRQGFPDAGRPYRLIAISSDFNASRLVFVFADQRHCVRVSVSCVSPRLRPLRHPCSPRPLRRKSAPSRSPTIPTGMGSTAASRPGHPAEPLRRPGLLPGPQFRRGAVVSPGRSRNPCGRRCDQRLSERRVRRLGRDRVLPLGHCRSNPSGEPARLTPARR